MLFYFIYDRFGPFIRLGTLSSRWTNVSFMAQFKQDDIFFYFFCFTHLFLQTVRVYSVYQPQLKVELLPKCKLGFNCDPN